MSAKSVTTVRPSPPLKHGWDRVLDEKGLQALGRLSQKKRLRFVFSVYKENPGRWEQQPVRQVCGGKFTLVFTEEIGSFFLLLNHPNEKTEFTTGVCKTSDLGKTLLLDYMKDPERSRQACFRRWRNN